MRGAGMRIASGFTAVLFTLILAPFAAFAEGEVEAEVRAYFADTPVMIAIAKCESNFTQFGKGGTPLHGGMGGKMIGIFQVYGDIHATYAHNRGMDIMTMEGNLAYAKHLYEREGTKPWLSSFPCWGKQVESAENMLTTGGTADTSAALTENLSLGMEHPQILTLQKLLNGKGFVLATEGPGSPGNETNRYGALTRDAVRKFQCAEKIVCGGDEYSSGYGYVGARTRVALLATGAAISTPQTQADPATATVSTSSNNSNDAEIARLQAQISELTKLLAELLAKRG